MKLIRDTDIDYNRYLRAEEVSSVRPASDYAESTIEYMYGPKANAGGYLPWRRTHSNIRLRPAEFSIWAGVNGHGKSGLLNQVMLWLNTQSELACIASMEMTPEATMKRYYRQYSGREDPSPKLIREEIGPWSDGKLWLYDKQGTVSAEKILAVIRYCFAELKVSHFVVDSLLKCGLAEDDYNGQKAFANDLFDIAKEYHGHIHLVCHSRKRETERKPMDKFDIKGSGSLADIADNIFTVWKNKAKLDDPEKHVDAVDAVLICDKQRHGEWEGRIPLWYHKPSFQCLAAPSNSPMRLGEFG